MASKVFFGPRTINENNRSRLRIFFFSSRRRHTRWTGDWSSDVCSSDLARRAFRPGGREATEVQDHRGGGHGFRAAYGDGEEGGEDQSFERGGSAGARDSLHSRRDVDQRVVYLETEKSLRVQKKGRGPWQSVQKAW